MTNRAVPLAIALAFAVALGSMPSPGPVAAAAPPERSVAATAPAAMPVALGETTTVTTTAARASVWHVPVLMYHLVGTFPEVGRAIPGLVVPPRVFTAQLTALKRAGWRSISTGELATAMAAGTPLPRKSFVITLDDGHVDGYTNAFPILQRLGFTATFYVITGRIGKKGYLTWDQLREMAAAGMEIGNHTRDHVSFRGWSAARLRAEVADAQRVITAKIGTAPASFAYPFGIDLPLLRAAVRAAGIPIAFTTRPGAVQTRATAYVLPRIRVGPGTSPATLIARFRALVPAAFR